jgi:hypothetical protein
MLLINGCVRTKDEENPEDKFLVVTNDPAAAAPKSSFSTVNSVKDHPTPRNLELTPYPVVKVVKEDVYILEADGKDILKKYHRFSNGDILPVTALSLPAGSGAVNFIMENATRGYCSLTKTGKILVFNAESMSMTGLIDLSSYAINDASPDPTIMAFAYGKLYVVCNQVYNGKTIPSPAQVLIIDVANGNKVTNVTDDRAGYSGTTDTPSSVFFTENGDFYLYCVSSRGSIDPTQSGFLRIRSGQTSFDLDYYFSIGDLTIAGVQGDKVNYLQRPLYVSGGIVLSTGNIPALAGNPQNYITDQSFGSFKIDLSGKTISKIDFPYSNGYANSLYRYNNIVYVGLSTSGGIGFFEYDITSGKASTVTKISTAGIGDPWLMATF